MNRYTNWKKRRKLERELRELDEAYAPQFKATQTADDYYPIRAEYDYEAADSVLELERMKTREARRRAERFGIEFPPYENDEDNWEEIPYANGRALTEKAHAKINRQINDAQFTYWKRWVELLVPILSLLIAIIALLKK